MAVRSAFTLAVAILLGCGSAMNGRNLSIDVIRSDNSVTVEFKPADRSAFKVRGIFIVDDRGEMMWGVIPDSHEGATTPAVKSTHLELKGGHHEIRRKPVDDASLPEEVLRAASRLRSAGHVVMQFTYGQVPDRFQQIIPEKAEPRMLERGETYTLYVLGTEGGAFTLKP